MMGLIVWTYKFENPSEHEDGAQSELSEELREAIENQVENVVRHKEGVTFGEVISRVDEGHDKWEPGKPCPECGSRQLCVANVSGHIYYSGEGKFEKIEPDDSFQEPVVIICDDCRTPIGATLDHKFDE